MVQLDTPLKQLFAQLEAVEAVNIYKQEIPIGSISRENVFAFLSGETDLIWMFYTGEP